MTDMAGSNRSWNGPTGHVDAEMLKTHIDDLAGPVYYIAGPPGMVAAMQRY
jgi:NAD(P)H-flavin reductase